MPWLLNARIGLALRLCAFLSLQREWNCVSCALKAEGRRQKIPSTLNRLGFNEMIWFGGKSLAPWPSSRTTPPLVFLFFFELIRLWRLRRPPLFFFKGGIDNTATSGLHGNTPQFVYLGLFILWDRGISHGVCSDAEEPASLFCSPPPED